MPKMRLCITSILVLLWALSVNTLLAATGWQPLAESIRKSERDTREYKAIRLDNGMTVLLVSSPEASKSLAALALPIGSLDDPDNQLGLAHYLEHMVLMGSTRYPEADGFAQFLKKHGGTHNASTAPYRTAFYLEVENDALAQAVDRLADVMAAPLLGEVNADRERNAVNAEMTLARSRDGLRMGQIGAETLNPAHPSARFSGGNLDTLKDKPGSSLHSALVDFYQRYYSANLMQGVIYSNKPLAELIPLAVETYGRIPNRQATVPVISVPVATEKEKGIIIHYVPAQPRKALRIEFRVPNDTDKFRSKTNTYISYLIGNNSKGTLSDWLKEQGLVESISAGADSMSDRNGGLFTISIALTDKGLKNRDSVIAAVFHYMDQIRQKGVDQRYFNEIAHVLDLDFRYPSITHDMEYIEWLVDNMLRVPVEHVLDSAYLADRYDPKAINERLNNMTPQQARIWFISPDEPHNKLAYFVDAPYQVERISSKKLTHWQQLQQGFTFSLPALNPYIPDDFSLIAKKATPNQDQPIKPQLLIDKPDLRAWYMPSRYFADEPKANVQLALRTEEQSSTARQQVMFALTDYLAGISLAQLRYQASVGGIDFATSGGNGLKFSASGFSQRLPELLSSVVNGYRTFTPSEEQLIQAKSWYTEQLDIAEKGKAFELAIQPAQSLSQVPYYERNERRKLLSEITLPELLAYRESLLKNASLELLAVGNITEKQTSLLAEQLKAELASTGKSFWRGQYVQLEKNQRVNLQREGGSTDSALAALYVPIGYSEVESMAYSQLLEQIIQPLFYNQLRTEEQLGYAVFAFSMGVGRQWGIAFLLQTNSKDPAYLYQRYTAFYPQAEKQLRELSDTDFNQYKKSLITQLQERPQNLDDETSRVISDFNRGNTAFDSREKLIAQLSNTRQAELLNFYQQAVMQPTGLALLSQVVGKGETKAEHAAPAEWQIYPNVSSLQRTLKRVPVQ